MITIEVTPEEAEKVALAASEGRIQLALRNFSDTGDVITKGTTIPTLLASYSQGPVKEAKANVARVAAKRVAQTEKPAPAPAMEKPPAKPPVFVVQMIKGTQVSEVKFEGRE